jgi:hypothetical protein
MIYAIQSRKYDRRENNTMDTVNKKQWEDMMKMKNPVLTDIMKYAVNRLNQAYGFCGVASSDDMAMLNSDDREGKEIKIVITAKNT